MSSKIKLKIKNLDQLKVILDDLGSSIQGEIEITLNLQENKETMSYLCSSKCIEDWDYTAEKKEAIEEIAEKLPSEDKIEIKKEKTESGFFYNLGIERNDWNMIAWIIEAIWKMARTRSAVKFQSEFFYDVVKENINQKTISPEHALLAMAGESYYSEYPWESVEEDLQNKISKLWISGKISEMTLSEVATKLYRR